MTEDTAATTAVPAGRETAEKLLAKIEEISKIFWETKQA